MAKKLCVAIIGFGPFGRAVEENLRGDVSEILIVGKESQHLEKFSQGNAIYNPNVRVLRGEIDETLIDEALEDLGVLPPLIKIKNGNSGSKKEAQEAKKRKIIDWAIIDMADTGMNDYVAEKVSPYVEMLVVATRNPAHVEALTKLGANWVICPEEEASERVALSVEGLKARDVVKVSDSLDSFEASMDVPDSFTGKSLSEIQDDFDIRVLFLVRSTPQRKGRSKKVAGYEEELIDPEALFYRIHEYDTLMRVRGSMSALRKFAQKIK